MIYLTGDTHRDFSRIQYITQSYPDLFAEEDTLVILGDAGINYYGDERDVAYKKGLHFPFKLFCIHGNHEMRPTDELGYHEEQWRDGTVFVDEHFPNILFAKDGEVYDFDGQSAIVIGGAYSVDKPWRLANSAEWFPDEQPSQEIRRKVEKVLSGRN